MAAFLGFDVGSPVVLGSYGSAASRLARGVAIEFAALAAHGWGAAAEIAVFLWMALLVAFFGLVAAGLLLA